MDPAQKPVKIRRIVSLHPQSLRIGCINRRGQLQENYSQCLSLPPSRRRRGIRAVTVHHPESVIIAPFLSLFVPSFLKAVGSGTGNLHFYIIFAQVIQPLWCSSVLCAASGFTYPPCAFPYDGGLPSSQLIQIYLASPPLPYLQPVAGCQGMNFHFLPRESITWLSPEFALSELLHPPDLWLVDESWRALSLAIICTLVQHPSKVRISDLNI